MTGLQRETDYQTYVDPLSSEGRLRQCGNSGHTASVGNIGYIEAAMAAATFHLLFGLIGATLVLVITECRQQVFSTVKFVAIDDNLSQRMSPRDLS
jgi:hypothetical protein